MSFLFLCLKAKCICCIPDKTSALFFFLNIVAFGLSTFSRTKVAPVLHSVEAANHLLAVHVIMMDPT